MRFRNIEMKDTELVEKCKELMLEVNKKFDSFTKIFLDNHEGVITEDGMLDKMREIVINLNESEIWELNELAKMFSTCNCSWYTYDTGRIVHELLCEKWFDGYKINYEHIDR